MIACYLMSELADYTQGSVNRQTPMWVISSLFSHDLAGEVNSSIPWLKKKIINDPFYWCILAYTHSYPDRYLIHLVRNSIFSSSYNIMTIIRERMHARNHP